MWTTGGTYANIDRWRWFRSASCTSDHRRDLSGFGRRDATITSSAASYTNHGNSFVRLCNNARVCDLPANRSMRSKKLTRCWGSATSEPLDAEIIAAEVRNSIFFNTPLVFLSRFRITRYHNLGERCHTANQNIILSFGVSISTFCCPMWSPSTNDIQTDRHNRDVCMAYRAKRWLRYCRRYLLVQTVRKWWHNAGQEWTGHSRYTALTRTIDETIGPVIVQTDEQNVDQSEKQTINAVFRW